jgi:flagellar L-ring protein FlgH
MPSTHPSPSFIKENTLMKPASARIGTRAYMALIGLGLALSLSGCGVARATQDALAAPELSPISNPGDVINASTISMPGTPQTAFTPGPNSIWSKGRQSLFSDQRAGGVGDILTVQISISDRAQVQNTTSRSRSGSEDAGISAFLGFENELDRVLPNGVTADPLVGMSSSSASNGAGQVNRAETITLTVAAVVTGVLPNGNLIISGRQEVRVNNEVRELLVSGVIRPQDIKADNTIDHTQIAEARISYGGRGDISTVQRPRYGQRLFGIIAPW